MSLIQKTIASLKKQYFADERPWVVTHSGGKDSTCVLQLTLAMLQELHAEGKGNNDFTKFYWDAVEVYDNITITSKKVIGLYLQEFESLRIHHFFLKNNQIITNKTFFH